MCPCSKTLLLFVIRDHDEETPLEALKDKLMEGMTKIWAEVNKPDRFKDSTLDTFFEFEFVSLPHKKHQAREVVHAKAVLGRFSELDQYVVPAERHPALFLELPLQHFEDPRVRGEKRAPCLQLGWARLFHEGECTRCHRPLHRKLD